MMKMHYAVPMALMALGMLAATPALAQGSEGDVGEVMMQVAPDVEDGEVEFTEENRIELPPAVPEESAARENAENAAFGLETANEARQLRELEDPEAISEAARELGRDADEIPEGGNAERRGP